MRKGFEAALAIAIAATLAAGCSHTPKPGTASAQGSAGAPGSATAQALAVLEAKITPTQGNTCQGTVRFEAQKDGSVKVTANLTGLDANTVHGIHVHETGDCSAPDAMSAGGHYNPTQQPHALPPTEARHAGDLGNLTADAKGNAHYEITVNNISLSATGNSVLGRAVIVHAKPDDGGQPTGNAGARVGCGVISAR
jgi:Cu-Zn family superoxide dismutase